MGNMKQVLCTDWIPELARWADLARSGSLALITHKERLRGEDLQSASFLESDSDRVTKSEEHRYKKSREGAAYISIPFPALEINK